MNPSWQIHDREGNVRFESEDRAAVIAEVERLEREEPNPDLPEWMSSYSIEGDPVALGVATVE